MYQFLKGISFRLCVCFVHTIAQFSRILRFSLIYCLIFRIVPFHWRKSNVITSTIYRAKKVRKTFPEGCKTKSGIVFRYCKSNILQLLFDTFSDVTIILVSLLSSFRRYYHHQMTLLSSSDDVTIIVHLRYYRPRCFFNVDFLSI
jgi:hypothetical protein